MFLPFKYCITPSIDHSRWISSEIFIKHDRFYDVAGGKGKSSKPKKATCFSKKTETEYFEII
jgi:hypothetical protein